ncbi:MAG: restriction endonuclease subunit S, partial [Anaerolineales bacterium]|nr:restriction endonuclease subunit S [Anaerolineales bacterium]
LDRNLGKTAPLNENDLMDFVHSQKTKALSENSWVVNLADVDKITYDLSVKNPSRKNETTFRNPQDILDDIKALDSEGSEILRSPIFSFTNDVRKYSKHQWQEMKLGEVLKLEYGKPLPDSKRKSNGLYPVYGANGEKDRTDEFYYDKSSIIVGRKGSAFVTFEAEKHDLKFIYYLLQSLELPKLAKGVKPGINRNEVYSIPVLIPPLAEQRAIVGRLEALSAETGRLEEIYQSKVEALEELKKSVLQKAFAGEL